MAFKGSLYHTCILQTLGNILKYTILYSGRSPTESGNETIVRDLSICGRNDCQDPSITNANIERYEPASQSVIHILIAITAGLIIFSIILHGIFIKDMDPIEKVQNAKQMKGNNDVSEDVIDNEIRELEGSAKNQVFV